MKFDSEGFDLDAVTATAAVTDAISNINITTSNNNDETKLNTTNEVVYEIGGGITTSTTTPTTKCMTEPSDSNHNNNSSNNVLQMAEAKKTSGNEYYKLKEYQKAYDEYTKAIDIIFQMSYADDNNNNINSNDDKTYNTPKQRPIYNSGKDILQLKDTFEYERNKLLRQQLRDRDSAELQERQQRQQKQQSNTRNEQQDDTKQSATVTTSSSPTIPTMFVLPEPKHIYSNELAIYFCNRAAALMQQSLLEPQQPSNSTNTASSSFYDKYDDDDSDTPKHTVHPKDLQAIDDCTIAILLNPTYSKAYIRRSTLYETRYYDENHYDLALQDAKMGQKYDPYNTTIQKTIVRLQQLEHERTEKLKEDTMNKLKDLGNSILGNFGLSLNNFKTQQDPNTGSYNISFQQNP